MNTTALLCMLILLIMTGPARAESFTGKVISIIDGNTICVACGDRSMQVKMSGEDCVVGKDLLQKSVNCPRFFTGFLHAPKCILPAHKTFFRPLPFRGSRSVVV